MRIFKTARGLLVISSMALPGVERPKHLPIW